jgi:hypothetical protein
MARPVCEMRQGVPKALSDIVMKLLSKNAEDRYQGTKEEGGDGGREKRGVTEQREGKEQG